jgi:hypothetical protein
VESNEPNIKDEARSHGREIEIGRYLGDRDRLILAREAKRSAACALRRFGSGRTMNSKKLLKEFLGEE